MIVSNNQGIVTGRYSACGRQLQAETLHSAKNSFQLFISDHLPGGCQGSLHYQRKQCTTIREIPQDYHEFGLGPIKWPLLYSCNPLSAIEGNQTSAIRHQVYNDWNQNGFPTLLGSVNFPCVWHVVRPATSVHWMNTFIVARESQWSPGSWGKSRVWKVPKWK